MCGVHIGGRGAASAYLETYDCRHSEEVVLLETGKRPKAKSKPNGVWGGYAALTYSGAGLDPEGRRNNV